MMRSVINGIQIILFISGFNVLFGQDVLTLPTEKYLDVSENTIIPINFAPSIDEDVYGLHAEFEYDSEHISIIGVETNGFISDSLLLVTNIDSNKIELSFASIYPVIDNGILLNFTLAINKEDTSNFILSRLRINEDPEIDQDSYVKLDSRKPPSLESPLGQILLNEDFGIKKIANLDSVFSDSGELTYEITDLDSLLEAVINNDSLTVFSLNNLFGVGEIIVSAIDEFNLTISDTLEFEISPVNDAPYLIANIDTLNVFLSDTLRIRYDSLFEDVDDLIDDLVVEVNSENQDISTSVQYERKEIHVSTSLYVGISDLDVSVFDSERDSLSFKIPINFLVKSNIGLNNQDLPKHLN